MSFNDKSRLDPSQVQDRRGQRTSGGMGGRVALGGGGLGLIILVVAMLMGVNPGNLTDLLGYSNQPVPQTSTTSYSDLMTECQTGADANQNQDCAIVGYVNSIQAFWTDEFAKSGRQYQPATTVLFSGATQAACGYASSAMGPFYCPQDQGIYLDLSFFEDLKTRFGAQGGPFAEAYILAHEYGHHVQGLLGILDPNAYQSKGPESEAVMTELQADCLAGIWMNNAVETGYIARISREDVQASLDAAASVGDDRIQKQTQGYVAPESWTHGSSEQRLAALQDGMASGDVQTCATPGW